MKKDLLNYMFPLYEAVSLSLPLPLVWINFTSIKPLLTLQVWVICLSHIFISALYYLFYNTVLLLTYCLLLGLTLSSPIEWKILEDRACVLFIVTCLLHSGTQWILLSEWMKFYSEPSTFWKIDYFYLSIIAVSLKFKW